jgi:lysophospholipase L1-like esterase
MNMAKKFTKKNKEEKQTRVKRNIDLDKDFYNTPVIIKDDINKTSKLDEFLKSKYARMLMIVFASILLGFVLFYSINYDSVNAINPDKNTIDKNYVFLGDSLMYNYKLDENFPMLKNKMVNSGLKGNTTTDILDNMYDRVYRYNPSDVFILVGTNDISKKYKLQKIFDNYVSIINQIEKNRPNTTIRVISLLPVNYDLKPEFRKINKITSINNLNAALKVYCKNNEIVFIDMYPKFVDSNDYLDSKYTKDGLHLNDEGYKIFTSVIDKYMED